MRVMAAIRTHEWGEEAARLQARLAPVFGGDLAVVFHNRPSGVVPDLPVIDVNDAWAAGQGLARVADWGWRCGDYAYYALRQARPGYDAYWLIEPDVHFTSEASGFFSCFAKDDADALGYRLGRFAGRSRFADGLGGIEPYQAIFALTRLSGRAIDRLLPLRRALSTGTVSEKTFPNDELFVFSHLSADPDIRLARIEDSAGDWFDGVQFAPDPDLLFDVVAPGAAPGRVWHPVRSREAYMRALAGRLAAGTGVLFRSRGGLRALADTELQTITAMASERMLAAMRALQQRGGRDRGGA